MMFKVLEKSVFDVKPVMGLALVNTVNCVGVMGAGIALQFKKKYPQMFDDYARKCKQAEIRPGQCYTYFDKSNSLHLLGLAVKDDWRQWSTLEWIEQSIQSMKLVILENDIQVVNLPLPGGKNGRRGPYGPVQKMTPPPADTQELKDIVQGYLEPFAKKFKVTVNLCIPSDTPLEPKPDLTLEKFFEV